MSASATTTFSGTGGGDAVRLRGHGNARLSGTFVGTLRLEKSFDNGATWHPVAKNEHGDLASYTSETGVLEIFEPRNDVLWRWNCTAYTSGSPVGLINQ